jgi:predicted ferric reductase
VNTQVLWYSARAAGIVAWVLATASVVWGLALSTRATGRTPRPAWLFDLHRFLGGIALAFTGIHVGSLLLDSYVHFSLVNILVPLTGTWHPLAVAWGVVAFYALLAVELTSLARSRIPKILWRRVHFASFALFAAGTVHALSAGTDSHSTIFTFAALGACGLIGALTAIRVAGALEARARARRRPAPPAPAFTDAA